ncbi:MAG TPA: helix-turn-helix domain-containing protein [Actinoplanes sp.]
MSAARGPYYRPADVARLLRCSEWWVKEQARRRRIPYCWIGGSYLFTDEHIAAIVRLFEVQPDDATGPATGRTRRTAPHPHSTPAVRLVARVPRRARAAGAGEAA